MGSEQTSNPEGVSMGRYLIKYLSGVGSEQTFIPGGMSMGISQKLLGGVEVNQYLI